MKFSRMCLALAGLISCASSQAIVLGTQESDPGSRVSIRASNVAEFPTCGGTMVTEQWVLTAAHCVVMGEGSEESPYYVVPPTKLAIAAEILDLNTTEISDYYDVSHVVVHPNYTRHAKYKLEDFDGGMSLVHTGLNNDIALLYLKRPVTNVALSDLATSADMPEIERRLGSEWNMNDLTNERTKNVTVSGWGNTKPDSSEPSPLLLSTQSTFLPIVDCYQRLEVGNDLPGIIESPANITKLCTLPTEVQVLDPLDSTQYGNSACQGDSGGPLVDDFSGKQIGVVSGAPFVLPTCGSITIPSFFTKVSTYYDWIKGYINASNPPSSAIIAPSIVTEQRTGTCSDAIATNNCNYRGSESGGSIGGLWLLLAAPLMYWRRRK